MSNAKVLIPESARLDVVSPLIDRRASPDATDAIQGSGGEEGKEGDKREEVAKDDKLASAEIDPAEITRAREHFGL